MTDILIEGGRALLGNEIAETSLRTVGRDISAVGADHGRGKREKPGEGEIDPLKIFRDHDEERAAAAAACMTETGTLLPVQISSERAP